MSHLTREQLEHLCKLTALEFTPEEQAHLLPQLDQILTFVSQLQESSVDSRPETLDGSSLLPSTQTTLPEADFAAHFFSNIHHPTKGNTLQLETGLTRE